MNRDFRLFPSVNALAVVLSLVGGCSSTQLQDRPDSAPPDSAPPDSAPPDGGPPPDSAPPFTGVRSFTVTSQLHQSTGGVMVIPASHVFTLVLDGDRSTALAGGAGEGSVLPFERVSAGTLHIVGSAQFHLPGACSGSSITYDDLRFVIDANGGLTGNGHGSVTTFSGDFGSGTAATMSLTGVADTQPPTLIITGDAADPFAWFAVVSSEPLQPSANVTLRAANGEIEVLATGGTFATYVAAFPKPMKMLRYATQYQVTLDGVADFAGNAATAGSGLTFTTGPLPPLAAEDGFESVTDTSFAGAQVLSGAGAPTITGSKSLYIAPASSAGLAQSQLVLRLPVAAGDTMVRFAYRTVRIGQYSNPASSVDSSWRLGSANGPIAAPSLPSDTGASTMAMIGDFGVTLGPTSTATFTLPAGGASEVVIQRTSYVSGSCSGPPPASTGIIIDDLRAE